MRILDSVSTSAGRLTNMLSSGVEINDPLTVDDVLSESTNLVRLLRRLLTILPQDTTKDTSATLFLLLELGEKRLALELFALQKEGVAEGDEADFERYETAFQQALTEVEDRVRN